MIAVVVDGCPERAKEEEEELAECLRALARSGVEHVAVVEGGYYAVHELLYRTDWTGWWTTRSSSAACARTSAWST